MQWTRRSWPIVLAAAALLFAATTASGQGRQNPFTSAADTAEGERLFQRNCVLCHGGNGTGGRGPDLTRGFFRRGNSDEQLFEIVQDGLPEAGMPWQGLSDKKSWQVIAYVRSLSARNRGSVPGDPETGRELFYGLGNCGSCHMVNGTGSRQGPDLSWIGWRRAPDYLRAALLDPNDDVDPRWWRGTIVTSDGRQIEGYLIDEDQFSVRLLDEYDNLHALGKQDLSQFERTKTSKMLIYGDVFNDEQLTDIVAFLAGLWGGESDR